MVEQLDFIKRLLQILGFVINSEKSRGQIDGIFGYDRVLSFHAVPFARKKGRGNRNQEHRVGKKIKQQRQQRFRLRRHTTER
jgi:hypothetical protein